MRKYGAMTVTVLLAAMAAACSSGYAVRPVPRIAKESVGRPIRRLQQAFGEPRKIDEATSKIVYVWFLPKTPPGAPVGLHGCELEVTVDVMSEHVLGYALSNIGWGKCAELSRRIQLDDG